MDGSASPSMRERFRRRRGPTTASSSRSSEDGDTFVLQAGREFKVLGRNSLGEMTLASPAVANGSVIIRTATKLYRIARAAR